VATTSTRASESHELVLAARPDAPAVARRTAADFVRHQGAGADVAHAVELAVSEAVSNVVVHAYAGSDDPGEVRLELERTGDGVMILVADAGKGMSPRPDSPGLGLGLPLIGRLADSYDVRSDVGRGTELRMRFELSQAA
jgi:anti-sigma regulatory factor (Ser/Thr protein kinase)